MLATVIATNPHTQAIAIFFMFIVFPFKFSLDITFGLSIMIYHYFYFALLIVLSLVLWHNYHPSQSAFLPLFCENKKVQKELGRAS